MSETTSETKVCPICIGAGKCSMCGGKGRCFSCGGEGDCSPCDGTGRDLGHASRAIWYRTLTSLYTALAASSAELAEKCERADLEEQRAAALAQQPN